jgi:hypothetical protein
LAHFTEKAMYSLFFLRINVLVYHFPTRKYLQSSAIGGWGHSGRCFETSRHSNLSEGFSTDDFIRGFRNQVLDHIQTKNESCMDYYAAKWILSDKLIIRKIGTAFTFTHWITTNHVRAQELTMKFQSNMQN